MDTLDFSFFLTLTVRPSKQERINSLGKTQAESPLSS